MRIYFEIKTQFTNLGDALINSCLINTLNKKGNLCVCTANVPEMFIKKLNLPNDIIVFNNKKQFYMDMFKTKEKKYIFLNPGGEAGELSISHFIKKLLGLSRFLLIKSFGVSIIRIGVSYNNLGKFHTFYLGLFSKLITKHYVRDKISFNELKNKNIKVDGIVPDLAFLLEYKDSNYSPNKKVLVSIREYKNIGKDKVYEYLKNLIQEDSWDWSYQVDSDKNYIEDVLFYSNNKQKVKDLTLSITETKKFYSQYEYIITNRLHVLLLSASVGCKTIALLGKNENKKIEGILQDLKLNNLVYFMDEEKALSKTDINNKSISSIYKQMNKQIIDSIDRILFEVK